MFLLWFLLSFFAGGIAASKGRSGFGFFLLSLLLSPIIGIPAAMFVPRKNASGASPLPARRTEGEELPKVEVSITSGRSTGRLRGPASKPQDCWVPPGVSRKVRGVEIPGGMIYVGKALPALNEWLGVEPALIDPTLKAAAESSDEGEGMDYLRVVATSV